MIKTIDPYVLPIYDNVRFCIIDSDSVKDINKYLKTHKIDRQFDDLPYALVAPSVIKVDGMDCRLILTVINSSNSEFNTGVIVHEALHCVHYTFEAIEQRLVYNHESQNYLLEYFFNKISELIEIKE